MGWLFLLDPFWQRSVNSTTPRSRDLDSTRQNDLNRRSTVFLDEAGLPDERRESLKILHYFLDNPEVATVIISNRQLDAAKSNRGALPVGEL